MDTIITVLGITIGALVLLFVIFLLHHQYTHKRDKSGVELCCNDYCNHATTCHIYLQNNTHLLRGSECTDKYKPNKYNPEQCKNYFNKDTHG